MLENSLHTFSSLWLTPVAWKQRTKERQIHWLTESHCCFHDHVMFFLIKVNPVGIEWVLVWATNCLIPVCGDKIQGRRGNKVRIDNSIRHKTSISTPVSLQASLHPIYVLPKMDIGGQITAAKHPFIHFATSILWNFVLKIIPEKE